MKGYNSTPPIVSLKLRPCSERRALLTENSENRLIHSLLSSTKKKIHRFYLYILCIRCHWTDYHLGTKSVKCALTTILLSSRRQSVSSQSTIIRIRACTSHQLPTNNNFPVLRINENYSKGNGNQAYFLKWSFDLKIIPEFVNLLARSCKKPIFKLKSHFSKINKNTSTFFFKIYFWFLNTCTVETKNVFPT